MASSRFYVQKSVAPQFIEKFKAAFGNVVVGDPLEKHVTHGPQADEAQFDNVMKYIELGKNEGDVVLGGKAAFEEVS